MATMNMVVALTFTSNGIQIYLAKRRVLLMGERGGGPVLEVKNPLSGPTFNF